MTLHKDLKKDDKVHVLKKLFLALWGILAETKFPSLK